MAVRTPPCHSGFTVIALKTWLKSSAISLQLSALRKRVAEREQRIAELEDRHIELFHFRHRIVKFLLSFRGALRSRRFRGAIEHLAIALTHPGALDWRGRERINWQ